MFSAICASSEAPGHVRSTRPSKEVKTTLTPAPRLVGIEVNPGPTPKERGRARAKELLKSLTAAAPVSAVALTTRHSLAQAVRRPKQRSKQTKKSGGHLGLTAGRMTPMQALQAYIKCLRDPWGIGPVRLGWGTFSPTSLHSAFLRFSHTVAGTTGAFAIFLDPGCYVAGTTAATNRSFLTISEAATNAVQVGSSTLNAYAATNSSYLSTIVEGARVVSAAIRVRVRHAATSARGDLAGLNLHGVTWSELSPTVLSKFLSLNAARYADSNTAGQVGCEVQYRPLDVTDFSFNYNGDVVTLANTTAMSNVLTISGQNWAPGTFGIYIEALVHYETFAGIDTAGDDANPGLTLAGSGLTSDVAGAEASRAQPVIPSLDAVEMLDAALENAARSGSRTGMSLVGSGRTRLTPHDTFAGPNQGALPTGAHQPGSDFVRVDQTHDLAGGCCVHHTGTPPSSSIPSSLSLAR